jgi:DNA-binding MarR family transcriptional regulator
MTTEWIVKDRGGCKCEGASDVIVRLDYSTDTIEVTLDSDSQHGFILRYEEAEDLRKALKQALKEAAR